MDNFERTGVINVMDWLEEDARIEVQKKQQRDYWELKAKYAKLNAVAISEMYRSIECINDETDNCLIALGKVQLCRSLGLISQKVYSELSDYLENRIEA